MSHRADATSLLELDCGGRMRVMSPHGGMVGPFYGRIVVEQLASRHFVVSGSGKRDAWSVGVPLQEAQIEISVVHPHLLAVNDEVMEIFPEQTLPDPTEVLGDMCLFYGPDNLRVTLHPLLR